MYLCAVQHDLATQLWCGPAVVSAITSQPTSVIREHIWEYRRSIRRPKRVAATSEFDLRHAFLREGYTFTNIIGRGTVADWLEKPLDAIHVLMIDLKDEFHWIALDREHFVDNRRRKPVKHATAPYKRAKVVDAYRVRRPRRKP